MADDAAETERNGTGCGLCQNRTINWTGSISCIKWANYSGMIKLPCLRTRGESLLLCVSYYPLNEMLLCVTTVGRAWTKFP